jgi:lipopolysaccharide transport system ATP-binding protein
VTRSTARITVTNLSKVFDLQKRRRSRTGISSRELAMLGMLGRAVMQRGVKEGRRFFALRDISLEVRSGEIMGIIGRNGAGKSTMLKILARVLDPTAGVIRLNGRVAALLELGAGFSGDLTVAENIALHVALSGGKKDPALEERILELAELADFRDVDLDDCPGNAAARLSFATLISLNSEIVLADEMLAVGDERFKEMVLERIEKVRADGGCVLFVSHDLRAIAEICDRVMWIDRGQPRHVGTAREAIKAYEDDLHAQTSALDTAGTNDAGRIIDLRLADQDGHQVGSLRTDRSGFIECIFQHLRPDVPISLTFDLRYGQKQVVLSTAQTVEATGSRPRAFRGRVRIPARFLNQARYEVRARLRWTVEEEPQEVSMKTSFGAIDAASETSVWGAWSGPRLGLVAPRLRWRINKRKDAADATKQS